MSLQSLLVSYLATFLHGVVDKYESCAGSREMKRDMITVLFRTITIYSLLPQRDMITVLFRTITTYNLQPSAPAREMSANHRLQSTAFCPSEGDVS